MVSALLIAIITIGGWDKLQGAKPVNIFYVLVYLLFAYYVTRWNRGVLPVASALSVILIIFCRGRRTGLVRTRQGRLRLTAAAREPARAADALADTGRRCC